MKKKEPVKKVTKTPVKKVATKKPATKKTTTKKKEKEIHICFKCLNEVAPTTLRWVMIKDWLGLTSEILICDDCIEIYKEKYEVFEVLEPLYKKREYKKKTKDA